VYGEGYTLSGARHALEGVHRRPSPQMASPSAAPQEATRSSRRPEAVADTVGNVRTELREILSLLSTHQPRAPRQRARLLAVSPDSGSLFPL
jgi:hypothetical protein